jgi:hypothetical protein
MKVNTYDDYLKANLPERDRRMDSSSGREQRHDRKNPRHQGESRPDKTHAKPTCGRPESRRTIHRAATIVTASMMGVSISSDDPRGNPRDDPKGADYPKHEARSEYDCEIEDASFQNPHDSCRRNASR